MSDFRDVLLPFGQIYEAAHLGEQITAKLDRMTVQELREVVSAVKLVTESNCWWAIYGITRELSWMAQTTLDIREATGPQVVPETNNPWWILYVASGEKLENESRSWFSERGKAVEAACNQFGLKPEDYRFTWEEGFFIGAEDGSRIWINIEPSWTAEGGDSEEAA